MKNTSDDIERKLMSALNGFHAQGNVAITRKHLHDELLTRLREFIISGKIRSGEKIPEKELCAIFGVSRTPLREALKVMAFEGLISLTHNRGATVRPVTFADLAEIFPIYMRLEILAGELACERLDRADLDEMLKLHDQLAVLCRQDRFSQYAVIDDLIHTKIETAAANPILLQLLRLVSGRVRRARLSVQASQKRLAVSFSEHDRIMAALQRRDSAELSAAIRDHLESSFKFFKGSLAPGQSTN